jgi:hypothetical protein
MARIILKVSNSFHRSVDSAAGLVKRHLKDNCNSLRIWSTTSFFSMGYGYAGLWQAEIDSDMIF